MPTGLPEFLVVILLLTWLYFVGQLLWLVFGSTWVVVRETRKARAKFRRECAGLTTDEVRRRLLSEPCFTPELRANAALESFLARVAAGDEIAVRSEFSQSRLYRMLVRAERAAGRTGRPEAVDAISTIFTLLDTLAQRARSDKSGKQV